MKIILLKEDEKQEDETPPPQKQHASLTVTESPFEIVPTTSPHFLHILGPISSYQLHVSPYESTKPGASASQVDSITAQLPRRMERVINLFMFVLAQPL